MKAAPFSEPREWRECPCCRAGNWNRAACGEDPLTPCPECGQPPRCTWGQRSDRQCPRPATTELLDRPFLCGQHQRECDLAHEKEEWEIAGEYVEGFRKLAEKLCNWAILDALDLAWPECQMRQASAEAEQAMIWEGGDR